MRRVLGWADARAYDATMTTEHSAAASVVVPSRIDHLCAQLEAPVGSAALVVPATAWRVRVITHFLVRSVALVSRYRTHVLHWARVDGRVAGRYGGPLTTAYRKNFSDYGHPGLRLLLNGFGRGAAPRAQIR